MPSSSTSVPPLRQNLPHGLAAHRYTDNANKALSELGAKRDQVSSLSIGVPQMAGYYTPTIAKLLAIVEEMAVISTNAEVSNLITAYTSFLQAKERSGVERAMGGAGFGAGKFSRAQYNNFVGLIRARIKESHGI